MTLGKCLMELKTSNNKSRWFPKTKFTEYTGLKGKTPQNLSIDHYHNYKNTHKDLSEENMYLFRLGKGCFSLVESESILDEYFIDDNIFPKVGDRYVSSASQQDLFSFSIMPKLTENTLLSLGLATGVIQSGLGMDSEEPIPSPSEANGTYKFKVENPHNVDFFEHDGQVEIDTVVFGKMNGNYTLFVIEGKEGKPNSTLAKHKLAYPVMALASEGKIPDYIQIVPAYVRAWEDKKTNSIHYCIAKFEMNCNPRNTAVNIANVNLKSNPKHLFLQNIFS